MTAWQQERFERSLAGLPEIAESDGVQAVVACTSYWYDQANAAHEDCSLSEAGYCATCVQLRAAIRALPGEHTTVTRTDSVSFAVQYSVLPPLDDELGR